jgi:predicted nucleotidyltransferase
MSDNTQKTGGQDRKRINVNQDYELQDWSKKFGVTKERLKEAVQAVGDNAEKVQKYLKGGERSS